MQTFILHMVRDFMKVSKKNVFLWHFSVTDPPKSNMAAVHWVYIGEPGNAVTQVLIMIETKFFQF